jgi:rhodanese-related sulfurtransferase
VVIPGSDLFTQDLQQELFAKKSTACIILYDHCGKNVLDQVAWFRGHGLHETYGLRGGIDAWSQEIDSTLPRYRLEID